MPPKKAVGNTVFSVEDDEPLPAWSVFAANEGHGPALPKVASDALLTEIAPLGADTALAAMTEEDLSGILPQTLMGLGPDWEGLKLRVVAIAAGVVHRVGGVSEDETGQVRVAVCIAGISIACNLCGTDPAKLRGFSAPIGNSGAKVDVTGEDISGVARRLGFPIRGTSRKLRGGNPITDLTLSPNRIAAVTCGIFARWQAATGRSASWAAQAEASAEPPVPALVPRWTWLAQCHHTDAGEAKAEVKRHALEFGKVLARSFRARGVAAEPANTDVLDSILDNPIPVGDRL